MFFVLRELKINLVVGEEIAKYEGILRRTTLKTLALHKFINVSSKYTINPSAIKK